MIIKFQVNALALKGGVDIWECVLKIVRAMITKLPRG